jgi:class 3 adenylate cyclase
VPPEHTDDAPEPTRGACFGRLAYAPGMMAGFIIDLFAYVAVCTFLSLFWVVTGEGSFADLRHYVAQPSDALRPGFWPIWVWLGWGAAVVVHFGAVVAALLSPRRYRRRREAREAAHAARVARATETIRHVAPGLVPAGKQQHRWVAAMFTDIVDSTSLNETLGDHTWSEMLAAHREQVRTCMRVHGGTEVGTQGDGFLVRFDTPDAAVECAAAIQRELAEEAAASMHRIQVRIGIHAGEAVDEGSDLVGRVVNVASRVTGAAEPGEILVTEPVADHLTGLVALDDRGLVSLRGVAQARHLLAVQWAGRAARGQSGA